jgi:hypothetical protein
MAIHSIRTHRSIRAFAAAEARPVPGTKAELQLPIIYAVAIGASLLFNTNAGAAAETCGTPPLLKETVAATLLWQDCGRNVWTLNVTGGGSATTRTYTGSVTATAPATLVAGSSIESGDVLDTSDPAAVRFGLNVSGSGKDGFDFAFPSGAQVCVALTAPGKQVLVGPSRTPVTSPFDIRTLASCETVTPPPPPPPATPYAYLQDADTTDSVTQTADSDLGDRPFPRISTGPIKKTGSAEQFSKYGVIAVKSFSFDWLKSVQAVNPDTAGFRIHCPQEYQGFTETNACRTGNGMPFDGTGSATANCNVYAGHWLYAPGTTLTSAITNTSTSLQVADATRFTAGRYIVVYDGGAGAFQNAEHAKVTAVNTSTKTLTLASRGFKSTARAHSAGAVVAEHTIGNGDAQEPENWVYNHSTASPRDSSGRQINQAMAEWLAANWNTDQLGKPASANLAGILFDSDFHFIMDGGHGRKPDVDNDLVQDNGFSAAGENLWGEGLDEFYRKVRELLPNVVLVGGVTESRGYTSLDGNQLEGWPQRNAGSTSATADYREIDGRLSTYSMQMHHGTVGPRYAEGINKMPTKLYPSSSDPNPRDNTGFRFGYGLILLDDGHYGQQNWHVVDPWWDEYAVDVVPGSPNYGRAVASDPQNEAAIRSHSGWMGFPLGPRERIYDLAAFAPGRSLIADGSFDANITGWSGSNVTVNRDTAERLEGSGALHISKQISHSESETGASASGPTVSLKSGVEYTLAFAVKSSAARTIQVAVGSETEQFYVPDGWSRQVFTFKATGTSNRLKLNVGRESTDLWIDSVYLFEGNADVFRRDFDNAVVIVNATPSSRTVDLGGAFQRIRGTQDPINNGASLTAVTVAPYDTAILVRPQ